MMSEKGWQEKSAQKCPDSAPPAASFRSQLAVALRQCLVMMLV